jgi:hypothetical protein
MPMVLRPKDGFVWMKIQWGAPDQVRTVFCSYCDQPLDDESVPLILWREDGWCAEFCDACQRDWWGVS